MRVVPIDRSKVVEATNQGRVIFTGCVTGDLHLADRNNLSDADLYASAKMDDADILVFLEKLEQLKNLKDEIDQYKANLISDAMISKDVNFYNSLIVEAPNAYITTYNSSTCEIKDGEKLHRTIGKEWPKLMEKVITFKPTPNFAKFIELNDTYGYDVNQSEESWVRMVSDKTNVPTEDLKSYAKKMGKNFPKDVLILKQRCKESMHEAVEDATLLYQIRNWNFIKQFVNGIDIDGDFEDKLTKLMKMATKFASCVSVMKVKVTSIKVKKTK